MECLTTFDQLTAKLDEAVEMNTISVDAHRQSLSSWYLSHEMFGSVPQDPFSQEFKSFQFDMYERLTGRAYELNHEKTPFDFEHQLRWPHPYGTQSAGTIGTYLMSHGWLIKTMDLPPRSRILEMGSGFGSLTVHLAGMGYQVTCLDVNQSLLEFTEARTQNLPGSIMTVCGDMATAEISGPFDAIIFNAALHHSIDHRETLQRMENLLTPDGMIAFVAEPIEAEMAPHLPYPWGLRLDGLSVYCICVHGWMELGFRESYFIQIMNDAGWGLTRHHLGLTGHTDVWLAKKNGSGYQDHQNTREQVLTSEIAELKEVADGLQELVGRLQELVDGYERGRFIRLMKKVDQLRKRISST